MNHGLTGRTALSLHGGTLFSVQAEVPLLESKRTSIQGALLLFEQRELPWI